MGMGNFDVNYGEGAESAQEIRIMSFDSRGLSVALSEYLAARS